MQDILKLLYEAETLMETAFEETTSTDVETALSLMEDVTACIRLAEKFTIECESHAAFLQNLGRCTYPYNYRSL